MSAMSSHVNDSVGEYVVRGIKFPFSSSSYSVAAQHSCAT